MLSAVMYPLQALYVLTAALRGVKKTVTEEGPRLHIAFFMQEHPGFLKLIGELASLLLHL